ncbi:MAG: hypothetical protein HY675_02685 [Chloroflexi bacterium]|nr:hypothetical protein [Chloroflexota bacterium]
MDRYWNPYLEMMSPQERRRLQETRFLELVRHTVRRSDFYRRKYQEAGVDLDKIRSLDDIRRLPTVDKNDFRDSQLRKPPYGDYTGIEVDQAITLHGSGGTTGKPMLYLDSRTSWEAVADIWATSLVAQGVGPGSRVFFPFAYSTFVGYWGAHYAVEKIGAVAIPAGGFDTATRVKMLVDVDATNVIAMPSYCLVLAQTAEEMGIHLARDTQVIGVHHAAEPGGSVPGTKKRIESYYTNSYDNYGMVELGANSLFECARKTGMHVLDDQYILEVLHPETREPVKEGEVGELVWTSIALRSFDAQPLIRCSSKDLAVYTDEPCACGRTYRRVIGGILGRTDTTKKVKGVLLYPSAIESTLSQFTEIGHEWEAIINRVENKDSLTVQIEVDTSQMRQDQVQDLSHRVQRALRADLYITPEIDLVPMGQIAKRYEGVLKPTWKRVVDKRDVAF